MTSNYSARIQTKEFPAALRQLVSTRKKTLRYRVVPNDSTYEISASNWDGGSRTFTNLFSWNGSAFADQARPDSTRSGGFPNFFRGEPCPVTLDHKPVVLVESGTFNGKDASLFYIIPQTVAEHFNIPHQDTVQEG